ncbi:MAG: NRAMP family divalent metal transporter [Bacteroidia bacterium]|nr:NRAMP family divalent metal transporter [Bacteroidia bacterium]
MHTRPHLLSVLLGAAFLMATSAIGPGFLTQTTLFTGQLGASFGFAILLSILLDLGAQLNLWRIVALYQASAPEIADRVWAGGGTVLALLVAFGGLAFNIGNVAGAGLGLQVLTGLEPRLGAVISAAVAVGVLGAPKAGNGLDRFTQVLGILMIVFTAWIAIDARPPIGDALRFSIWPEKINLLAVVTLVGGTVGGYISFAGAHRLLDAGLARPDRLAAVNRSAGTAIGLASLMRILLFLAALGVVTQGHIPDPGNPAASVFSFAAGEVGYRLFGLVLWSAAITSVTGSAYTSLSFLKRAFPVLNDWENPALLGFIAVSVGIFVLAGKPVTLLVVAGALNGMILPVALGMMLHAVRPSVQPAYPPLLRVAGWGVAVVMAVFSGVTWWEWITGL